jgi:hypothetical protein
LEKYVQFGLIADLEITLSDVYYGEMGKGNGRGIFREGFWGVNPPPFRRKFFNLLGFFSMFFKNKPPKTPLPI